MRREDVLHHDQAAYQRALTPLKRAGKLKSAVIIGWDTEFTTHGRAAELLAQTLHGEADQWLAVWSEERGPPLLEWEELYGVACHCAGLKKGDHQEHLVLAVFYSQAEVQHMAVDSWEVTPWSLRPGAGHYEYADEKGRAFTIFDLALFFPGQSLAQVARSFGLEKRVYDVTNLARYEVRDPLFQEYALHDAYLHREILVRLRNRLFDRWQVDVLDAFTPAGVSARVYRRHYLKEKLVPPSPVMRRLTLHAALGGTVQAFNRGRYEGHHQELDSESNYAQCAVKLGALPRARDMFWFRSISEALNPTVRGGVVHVTFRFPSTLDRPCLPVQTETGRVYYPLEGASHCTVEEARLAVELGADLTLVAGWGYLDGDSTLPEYLAHLIEEKAKAEAVGDQPSARTYKMLANALTGKLAQRAYHLDPVLVRAFGLHFGLMPSEAYGMEGLESDIQEWLAKKSGGADHRVGVFKHGTCYRPEWYALITGYSRAAACQAFQDSRVRAGNVDSLLIAGEQVEPVVTRGIRFTPRRSGDVLTIYRERLWALFDGRTFLAGAQHGVHVPRAWEDVIPAHPDILDCTYEGKRMVTYRERLAQNLPLGAQHSWKGVSSTRWGWKRLLIDREGLIVTRHQGYAETASYGNGPWETAPWVTVQEAEEFIKLEAA